MGGRTVPVVRETPSLADSVRLLLETLGFRVVQADHLPSALDRLEHPSGAPVDAVVVVCNRDRSELLRAYPDSFSRASRTLPFLVVGDRPSRLRGSWPPNVRFVRLPIRPGPFARLLEALSEPCPRPEGVPRPEPG